MPPADELTMPSFHPPSAESSLPPMTISCAIDDVAMASLMRERAVPLACSLCDYASDAEAPASGLLMWSGGGDDVRFDEPPLCRVCTTTMHVAYFARLPLEEEG